MDMMLMVITQRTRTRFLWESEAGTLELRAIQDVDDMILLVLIATLLPLFRVVGPTLSMRTVHHERQSEGQRI
jgi:hypothetical protein